MPWYFPWSDSIKKRACRYLLQHYLGHFLKEKLSLDQLSVDLYNGKGKINDVLLDVLSLNEALDNLNIPVEIVDGFVGTIAVAIPWSALINDSTALEIHNLELTIQPKKRSDHAGVMLDSMFSSMTTSMQLAQECLKQRPSEGEEQADTAQPFEGLDMFAQTIEAVLTKVKLTFIDTIIRLEHLPKEAKTGAAIELRIHRIDYFDDQITDPGSPVDKASSNTKSVYEPAAIAHKNVHFMGVSVYCDEFPECHRTFSRETSSCTPPCSPGAVDLDRSFSPPKSAKPVLSQPVGGASASRDFAGQPESSNKDLEPIKVAVLLGRQELRMKIKQNEELAGPKLELDCHLGSVNFHLSPHQVHLLLEIAHGLSTPGSNDDSNMGRGKGGPNKPMEPGDYEKVEHELQKQLMQGRIEQRTRLQSWQDISDQMTTHSLDDSDEEDLYFDLAGSHHSGSSVHSMESSFSSTTTGKSTSTMASAMLPGYGGLGLPKKDSPFASSIPKGMRAKQKSARQRDALHKLLDDPAAEVTRYKLKISFLSLMILHEDPPATPSDAMDPGETSAERLCIMAEQYFGRVPGISTTGIGPQLNQIRDQFTEACPYDHLSILGKPVSFECNQKTSASMYSMTADVSIGLAEIVECVFDRKRAPSSLLGVPIDKSVPDYCELLVFLHDEEAPELRTTASMFSSMHAAATPSLKLKVTHLEKTNQSSRRTFLLPKTDIHFELAKCRSELDITLMDRIHALLNHQPLSAQSTNGRLSMDPSIIQSRQALFTQAMDDVSTTSESKLGLKVSSPFISLTIRFPIPDLRTGQGVDRLPWWTRSLRSEVAVLELSDAELQTTFCSAEQSSKFEFTCRDAHGLFQESADKPLMSFLRITTDDASMHEGEQGFNWPRLVIKKFPEIHSVLEEEEESEDSTPQDSLNGACQFTKPEPSPFSSSKAMFDNEELVMPGEKAEIQEFQEKAVNNTMLLVDFSLPNVNIQLPSKLYLEVLYNRLNNDLLMWEPLAPIPTDTHESYSMPTTGWDLNLATQLMHHGTAPSTFSMCKSGVQYDSSSDSEEESDPFYSVNDPRARQRRKQRQDQRNKQSKVCVNLTINKGKLRASTPLVEDGVVNKEKHGEFVIEIADGSLFAVVGYGGDSSLGYLCIESNRAALFHAGCVDIPTSWPVVGRAGIGIPAHLHPTIYMSEPGVHTKLSGQVGQGPDSMDMLSVAIKIKNDRPRGVKEFQIALGVRGGTLQHRVLQSGHGWFPQLVGLLDLKDYPILGYTMPRTLTELHCHLWSCAIDYRPLFLPMRALLTVESFSISSNIVLDTTVSMLRFIIEDAALYISKRLRTNAVDLKRNYVCVMDVGLLELSLRSSDGKDPKHPKTDLRLSNNIVHIRTCADSCRGLADLIQYFASDGDIGDEGDWKSDSTVRSRRNSTCSHSTGLSGSPQLTQMHMEQVHDMMADAMQESQTSKDDCDSDDESEDGNGPTEVFFFPANMVGAAMDDIDPPQSALKLPAPASPAREITVTTSSCGSLASSTASQDTEQFSADDEFCIIDDPGLGIAPRDGEPEIRVLHNDPIQITDNHFSLPLGKTDQLKAPEHFPPAVQRYTLREMSLVWYMYGGSDFSNPKNTADTSPTSLHGAKKSSKGATKMGRLGWIARGGPNRDVDTLMELQLSKVRMQYEVYPENTEQASRQIFIVNEVEVRDRLSLSKINKFLYQYTSESVPRQTHANMFVIKAVHMRPDPVLPSQECSLKVSILPLRLNVDQDSLFFLRKFFTSLTGEEESDKELSGEKKSAELEPVMTVKTSAQEEEEKDPDLLIMFDEMTEGDDTAGSETDEAPLRSQPTYFKSFVFSPDVPIRLDYHGKRVDMEQGTLAGLLVGLAQLNCSELRLKRLHHRHGLLGVHRLVLYALNEWLQDLKKNQLPSILGGVGPMYSLVQLVQGIRDLFWLPVEQYRKDGRIVRGLQRGAHSFTTSTAMAALELTNRLVQTVQYVAEVAFDMVSPGPSVRHKKHHQRLLRAAQPTDLREGVANAYVVVREGITGTAKTIAKVATDEHEQKGIAGAVGGVLRQVPPTLLQPVILATEATSNVLGGMRNQLRPDRKREDEDKWKPEES